MTAEPTLWPFASFNWTTVLAARDLAALDNDKARMDRNSPSKSTLLCLMGNHYSQLAGL